MAQAFEKCSNCGAPLVISADGREVSCTRCGSMARRAIDPARLFSALRTEGQPTDELLNSVAKRLHEAFPDLSRVEWSGGFLSAKRLSAFELTAGNTCFRLKHASNGILAERAEVVRGIVVKTTQLPVDEWLASLSATLSEYAAENSRSLAALQRLANA
jgi:hypothetical protein